MTAIIRQATPDDALAIGVLYNHYIEHSIATFQTKAHDDAYWHEWFAQFAEHGPHQCFVAVKENALIGFAYCMPYNQKGGYDQSVLSSIYLDGQHLGQGLGRKLYNALFNAIEEVHRIYAWIALPNEASITLHKNFGFKEAANLSEIGFKHGRYIDVAVMEKPAPSPIPQA